MLRKNGLHGSSGTSDAGAPYLSIVAMLVESYFLDSAWSIATAVSASVHTPSFHLFVTNDSVIKVCELSSK